MKHIKKFESESINQGEFLTYDEIRDFFQEFIDDNDFNEIKNHKPTGQAENISGFYDIEFKKSFNQSTCKYSSASRVQ